MNRLRALLSGIVRAKPMLTNIEAPARIERVRKHHYDGPPQPFDNMPFDIPNRALLSGIVRAKPMLTNIEAPARIERVRKHHYDGPPQPFDNMPFDIPNRYVATVFFSVFFGIGLWAPFIIVWYSMAKRTM